MEALCSAAVSCQKRKISRPKFTSGSKTMAQEKVFIRINVCVCAERNKKYFPDKLIPHVHFLKGRA